MADSKEPLLKHYREEHSDSHNYDDRTNVHSSYNSIVNSEQAGHGCCSSSESPGPRLPARSVQSPDEEVTQEGKKAEVFKVYKRRWYILVVFALMSGTQSGVWNTFGPISSSAEDAFGWTDATIALLSNWGPITYLLSGVFFSWVLDVKGLRLSCLMAMVLVAMGTAVRCITLDTPTVTWLTHVGHILNGLGGPVAMAAAPKLSATWFPVRERTTATAIANVFTSFGVAVPYLMGPRLVPDVLSPNSTNCSSLLVSSGEIVRDLGFPRNQNPVLSDSGNETAAERRQKEKDGIALYMYIAAGWSAGLLLVMLMYFPSQPPHPPCPSAAVQREDFREGFKSLVTRGQFWVVAMVYGVSTGTLDVWASVLDVILKPHAIDEVEAGWIGFYTTCATCAAMLIIARFADFFTRILKWLVFVSFVIGTAICIVFALATIKVIPPSTLLFYVTIISGNTALGAAVPLMYELACELAYPTGEGTTNMVMTLLNNFFGLVFLFVMMIPGIGSLWTSWAIVGTSGVCIPLLLLLKEQYNRLEVDEVRSSLNVEVDVPPPSEG